MAAFCTSVYSLSDKIAVAYLPTFGSQLGMVSASFLLTFAALSLLNLRETGQVVPVVRPRRRHLVVGGLCIGTSYAFVIHAMQYLPAAYVVTMTNAGLVLATVLSVFTFGERGHWRTRLGAAVVVSIGISFVAIELSR
jgi:drug/metabolite transporter (DMT)-like permease